MPSCTEVSDPETSLMGVVPQVTIETPQNAAPGVAYGSTPPVRDSNIEAGGLTYCNRGSLPCKSKSSENIM